VGKNAAVHDPDRPHGVRDIESHRKTISVATQALVLDHPPDSKRPIVRGAIFGDVGRGEVVDQILLKGIEDERNRDAQERNAGGAPGEAPMPRLHFSPPVKPRNSPGVAGRAPSTAVFYRAGTLTCWRTGTSTAMP